MVNIAKLTKKRLGEILASEGLLTEEQINEALKVQKQTDELLGEVLVRLGYVTEMDIARTIATQFGLPYINATNYTITREALNGLPIRELIKHQMVPLDRIGDVLILAVSGVLNEQMFERLEKETGCQVHLFVSTVSQVNEVIKTHFSDYLEGDSEK